MHFRSWQHCRARWLVHDHEGRPDYSDVARTYCRRHRGDDSNTAISKSSRFKSHKPALGGDKPSSWTCGDLYQY